MRSSIKLVLRSLSLAAILAFASFSTSAGPLEIFAYVDTPNQFFAVFNHGPIVPGEKSHTLKLDIFWQLNLNVLELGNPPLEADAVGISGTLQHSVTLPGPHEEGPGPIFSFGLIFNAAIGSGTTDIGPKVLPHEQHTDTFFAGIQWLTNPEKTRILSYSLTVYGNHPDPIPETEAILLFGTGLASLGLALRKRFRS